jgi:hypothetical protein
MSTEDDFQLVKFDFEVGNFRLIGGISATPKDIQDWNRFVDGKSDSVYLRNPWHTDRPGWSFLETHDLVLISTFAVSLYGSIALPPALVRAELGRVLRDNDLREN